MKVPYDIYVKEYGTDVPICTLTVGVDENREKMPQQIVDDNHDFPSSHDLTVYDIKQMISKSCKFRRQLINSLV